MALLVTGGCGFIGSNFINYYFHTMPKDMVLINLDKMYYCAKETNVLPDIRTHERYVFVKGDIKDQVIIKKLLQQYGVTQVIHFAAQSHVQNSFEDSLKFTEDNIFGTHTLLECCRKYGGIQKFVHVSTDEVYGESMFGSDELPKTEHSILCPTNPYAATKASAELLAQSRGAIMSMVRINIPKRSFLYLYSNSPPDKKSPFKGTDPRFEVFYMPMTPQRPLR
jgi:dTDP-D-glucose 4,6-dehydratase